MYLAAGGHLVESASVQKEIEGFLKEVPHICLLLETLRPRGK